jgi:hypothetical protein
VNRDRESGQQIGEFDLGDGNQLVGMLKIAGAQTLLTLHSKQFFHPITAPVGFIRGLLRDLTKVSLIDCISPGAGTVSKGEERNHIADVFPHFVVSGTEYLAPTEKTISHTNFVIDDGATLFYDFDAFGSIIDARPLISEVVKANKLDREVEIGDYPQIQYFTGKHQIFSTNTCIGRVSVQHSPHWSLPGPQGVHIRNTIRVSVDFSHRLQFHDVIDQIYVLRGYLGLLVGRPQNLREIHIQVRKNTDSPEMLQVDWSLCPTRTETNHQSHPHPSDVLIDAVRSPEEFSKVLANWLDRQPSWRDARHRFFGIFAEQRTYDVNRLIGAANMFDILPPTAVPTDVELSADLLEAKTQARTLFMALNPSPERNSVLSALGRLGKASLKRKVYARAQHVLDAVASRFPDLLAVLDHAVDCRNYFVHGGDPPLKYEDDSQVIWFFSDTLEFVFATSDLIETGWDINAWNARTSVSHPYGRYIRSYLGQLARLKTLANRATNVPAEPSSSASINQS